jgi:hypothetical protein
LLSPAFAGGALSTLAPRLARTAASYKAQSPTARYVQAGTALVAVIAVLLVGRGTPAENGAASTLGGLMHRAASAVHAAPKAAPQPSIPKELTDDVTILLDADTARERRAAADKILAYEPRAMVFPHVILIAEFESARSCKDRKQIIGKMRAARDVRDLPPLQRLARAPRSGCGFLGLGDCYTCLRGDLRSAISAIEGARPAPPKPKDSR